VAPTSPAPRMAIWEVSLGSDGMVRCVERWMEGEDVVMLEYLIPLDL
jgi:uncharacterized protein YodC (DUF2158 family)